MPKPRAMEAHEETLRSQRGEPGFDLLNYVLQAVNSDALDLSKVADDVDVARPTLERWLKDCGYRYAVQKRLEPIMPVEPGVVAEPAAS